MLFALVTCLLTGVLASPGDIHLTVVNPLILHPIALQWSKQAGRASFQQTNRMRLIDLALADLQKITYIVIPLF